MADKKAASVKDQRFQKVHNDPRFARTSKRRNKLQIDKRFAAVLKDERFQSVQGKYDKYGRPIEKKNNELKKFYRIENESDDAKEEIDESAGSDNEEEEENANKRVEKQQIRGSTTTSDDEEEEIESIIAKNDEKLTRLEYLNRMARGELASDSDDSSDSDSEDDETEDADAEEEEEEEKEDIPMGEETKRFAILNCDWTRIRAVDLFALCQSFAPATGAVQNVTIYPSDYGLEKMREEEQHGPKELWDDGEKDAKKSNETENESDEEDNDANQTVEVDQSEEEDMKQNEDKESESEQDEEDDEYDSDDPLGVKKSVDAATSEGIDMEKLRKYELQKLKYYYAVVTCDSVKTASTIFDNCDQLEYETSSNLLDLRFVPDDVEFANPPKEICENVPENYKPAIFATNALQQTEVKLTWEDDDDQRLELLTRPADWKNADDDDFAAYLASDVSSSDEEDAGSDEDAEEPDKKKAAKLKKLKNRYRKMLLGSDAEDNDDEDGSDNDAPVAVSSSEAESDEDENDEGAMEMTFTPGAGDILKAKKQRELEENETPFERYTREKKQQKNQKLHEKRTKQKQLAREQKEILRKKGKGAPNQVKLLREAIADDDDNDDDTLGADASGRNFDMKQIERNEKVKKLKGKRKAKELKKLQDQKRSGLQQNFQFDAADPRFNALYAKGSQFQLDPTDPKFKKTEATDAIFKERRKRNEAQGAKDKQTDQVNANSGLDEKKERKNELKAMVENLKRKSQQQKVGKQKKQKIL